MTKLIVFIVLSAMHVIFCALTDAYFNRLIFREIAKLPVLSKEKKEIYDRKEWSYVSLFFLIGIAVVIPCGFAYLIGGFSYVLIYLAILAFVQWDIIFGKVLMGDWFGDIPSMKLPKFGWLRVNLKAVVLVRLVSAVVLVYFAIRLGVV